MIPIIILAAGMSTRYNGNKLLEDLCGKKLIQRVVETTLESKADEVIVVTGFEAEKIEQALRDYDVKTVFNENYAKGMSTSVKKGVGAIKDYAEAVLIHPADVALISKEDINAVIDKYREKHALIVVTSYMGRHGHPILFDRTLFNEILQIREETLGLKAVKWKYKDKIVTVERGLQVLYDIDETYDMIKAKRMLCKRKLRVLT